MATEGETLKVEFWEDRGILAEWGMIDSKKDGMEGLDVATSGTTN